MSSVFLIAPDAAFVRSVPQLPRFGCQGFVLKLVIACTGYSIRLHDQCFQAAFVCYLLALISPCLQVRCFLQAHYHHHPSQ